MWERTTVHDCPAGRDGAADTETARLRSDGGWPTDPDAGAANLDLAVGFRPSGDHPSGGAGDASDEDDESDPGPHPDGGAAFVSHGDSVGDGDAGHGRAPGDHGGPSAESPPARIDQLATVDAHGVLRVVALFAVERAGTRWVVVILRKDIRGPAAHLSTTVGMGAVLVADDTICGGGISVDSRTSEGHGEYHHGANQYAAGCEDPGFRATSDTDLDP